MSLTYLINCCFGRALIKWSVNDVLVVTSAKEVMFSSVLVCLLAGLWENYSTDFRIIWWKSGK